MPSVQRFLSGRDNLVRTAVALAASSVAASTAIERTSAVRAGGGRVLLSGAYSGHEAAQVEVEIVAADGIPRASVPQFVGVGNGQLSVQGVDAGADQQTFSLTLADLGVPTASAGLDVREVRIRAKAEGDEGNAIRIAVQPQLVRTATVWALLNDWSAGNGVQHGPQWDFGGLPLSSKGELDPASPRIQFGFDPQVYRPYRIFKEGEWRYGVSPDLQRSVPSGTKVFTVTGGYKITVTDGVTVETYGDTDAMQPPVVSFHDMLVALGSSALVEVAGVVAADRTIGGQAAVDVPLRTNAWLLSLGGSVKLQGVVIPDAAPTQAVTVRCTNADVIGAERWSVAGDVSGSLSSATTGIAYESDAVRFTVPVIDPATVGSGEWSFKYEPGSRGSGDGVPSVCVRPFKLGRNAKPRTVTFRYQRRPAADCKCSDMPTPRVSSECLGIFTDEGGTMTPDEKTRLLALHEWRSSIVGSNIVLAPATDGTFPEAARLFADGLDVAACEAVVNVLQTVLLEISSSADALAEWDDVLTAAQAEFAAFADKASDFNTELAGASDMARKYNAKADVCRVIAGILPKSDSSSGDAGGCWIDHGGSFWWADTSGYYLPAFTNQPYISSRRNTETGEAYTTMEFGFGLVVACPESLEEGDTLTLQIEQVDGARPYQVGDEAVLQTVGAGPAWLTGGVDGTDVQTWRVVASDAGALPDYTVPTDGSAVPAYTQAGVTLQLALGGIPFALGDKFTYAVEAGQYRWRKDAGAWSAVSDIPAAGIAGLADGLQATFLAGAAPSFVAGDAYAFAVYQPNAASHVQSATAPAWAWAGAAASTTIDFGASKPLAMLAMARYSLPEGASATVQLSDDGVAWSAAVALDVSGSIALHSFDADTAARFLRVNVSDATGGNVGWLWAGVPISVFYSASSCQRTRRWAVQRGQGVNSAALYGGAGDGWAVSWDTQGALGGYLSQGEVADLLGMVDWAQQQDEPLIFLPHHLHPQDASLVVAGTDALDVKDVHEYQPNASDKRLLSASLTLDPHYS